MKSTLNDILYNIKNINCISKEQLFYDCVLSRLNKSLLNYNNELRNELEEVNCVNLKNILKEININE